MSRTEEVLHVRDTETVHVAAGKGKRDVVMIPGLVLGMTGLHGRGTSLAFAYRQYLNGFRLHFFDHARSLPSPCTAETLADDLYSAMTAAGIARADVVGVSQGGMIAQYLTLKHPGSVCSLVLAFTASRSNPTTEARITRWTELAQAGDLKVLLADVYEKTYTEAYMKRYAWTIPLIARTMKGWDTERFITLARACLTCETYDRLSGITRPVFVLGASDDRITTAAAAAEIASGIGCGYEQFEGLGHGAYDEAKDFNSLIFGFIKEH